MVTAGMAFYAQAIDQSTRMFLQPLTQLSGGQFVAIPEFQGIGTAGGQQFSAALAGQMSADDALAAAQANTTREMARAGYPK